MPLFIHKILDDLFEKKFGWRVRTQGVPTSKNLEQTREYGHPHYFFPIGDYKYAWNFDVIDLWFAIRSHFPFMTGRARRQEYTLSHFEKIGISKEKLYKTLEFYVNGFTEKKPTTFAGEVFIKCDEYYLLNVEDSIELFDSDEKKLINFIWGK